ncbi:hypothetical protein MPLSOD_270013 [Mesorhizobium sp. SOD10]|nr:hypothetical protein MPLSOD_270013 [Mesorhizobium sp. SOD10]
MSPVRQLEQDSSGNRGRQRRESGLDARAYSEGTWVCNGALLSVIECHPGGGGSLIRMCSLTSTDARGPLVPEGKGLPN